MWNEYLIRWCSHRLRLSAGDTSPGALHRLSHVAGGHINPASGRRCSELQDAHFIDDLLIQAERQRLRSERPRMGPALVNDGKRAARLAERAEHGLGTPGLGKGQHLHRRDLRQELRRKAVVSVFIDQELDFVVSCKLHEGRCGRGRA